MTKSIQIRITGRVQNVGFRYYTKQTAHELDLKGFVRNHPDGSVYVEAEGDELNISKFIGWCHQGPAWAHVESVDIQHQPVQNFTDFVVR